MVDRATGSKGGGGAVLTRYGQRLINCTICWRDPARERLMCSAMTDALPLDSLLAAISRFFLQTSAR